MSFANFLRGLPPKDSFLSRKYCWPKRSFFWPKTSPDCCTSLQKGTFPTNIPISDEMPHSELPGPFLPLRKASNVEVHFIFYLVPPGAGNWGMVGGTSKDTNWQTPGLISASLLPHKPFASWLKHMHALPLFTVGEESSFFSINMPTNLHVNISVSKCSLKRRWT